MRTKTLLLPKIIFGFAAIAAISAVPQTSAVPVTFSGGSGTPLSFSLAQPITYAITVNGLGPYFVFQGVGNPFNTGFSDISGTITYSVNGGAPIPFGGSGSNMASGFSNGSITPNDLYFSPMDLYAFNIGDMVVLSAGTLTTANNVPGSAASGSYSTFIAGADGATISSPGTVSAVPEALSTVWLGLPLFVMLATRRLRATPAPLG
jgi:hypothetical protein